MVKHKHMDLPIEGMHCASCVLSVNKTFGKIEGVEDVDADLASNKLHITVDTKKISYEEMERLVKNLGFELHSDEMTIRIQGMHCASCTMNVENFLIRLDGIFDVKADLTSQTAKIRYDSSKVALDEIEEVIVSLGFELLGVEGASPDLAGRCHPLGLQMEGLRPMGVGRGPGHPGRAGARGATVRALRPESTPLFP